MIPRELRERLGAPVRERTVRPLVGGAQAEAVADRLVEQDHGGAQLGTEGRSVHGLPPFFRFTKHFSKLN